MSVSPKASCRTTNSAALSASRTSAWFGMDCAGLVQAIQTALISPDFRPGKARRRSFQASGREPRDAPKGSHFGPIFGRGEIPVGGHQVGQSPTSRPPMAFGCPVSEKGPQPGFPIFPVAR